MKFLSGLLKTLSILIMLFGTIGCTALAVAQDMMDVYILMIVVWIAVMLLALNILGTGMALSQIVKLKKRVEALERSSAPAYGYPMYAGDYYGQNPAAEQPLYSQPIGADFGAEIHENMPEQHPRQTTAGRYAQKAPEKKRHTGAIIAVAVCAAVLVVGIILAVVLSSASKPTPEMAAPVETIPYEVPVYEVFPEDYYATEPQEEPAAAVTAQQAYMGETIDAGFVRMTFQDVVVAEDVRSRVTTGNVTRTTGPSPVAGQLYICITGTITNTSASELPVYDFFLGNILLDGYSYEVSATDCDVLEGDGSSVSNIAPLVDYTFRIYTQIPAALEHSSGTFTFGFFDDFANDQLSYNRAFLDDPVSACPYQYTLTIR